MAKLIAPSLATQPGGNGRRGGGLGYCGLGWLGLDGGELEAFGGRHGADGLMGPAVVVVVHPGVEALLVVLERVEDLAGQELGPQRLVPALDLPVVVGECGLVNR